MSNPLGKVIPAPKGRKLVISDIHGCVKTLRQLIENLQPTPEDTLFFLGDYVDKGPDSKGALDYLMELCETHTVHPVLGNHDLILLKYLRDGDEASKAQLADHNSEVFFDLDPETKSKYISFLESLHHYFICGDFILVHAGFNFNLSNPFLGKEDMLNIRSYYYDSSKAQNKTIVHGHVPHPKNEIAEHINSYHKVLPLDNGCFYKDEREDMGELLCLELNSMELHSQPNCE
ncbi:metallophosphoesterase family protein [Marinoscillum furvescens]|uniref:Serine/threonine protein phosphatase 1 n=1 Tax=Marinoscillum furvescens DSM 4134 TaxID=1122208 RepID=A0A3D9KZV9_MARFU|nr:metallophosphoesterase family protein [Marinoscillum furvescens]RED94117.1 serine/threonine protein phosphatase 1 [Marinoscillum furvescens DSM 4134]